MIDDVILEMKEYASINNVPIMTDDGIEFLLNYIKSHNIKRVLEVGTAIGYSAICMCSLNSDITVTSIERDENRYLEAVKNIKKVGFESRIDLLLQDALNVDVNGTYDLIFIDAAKAQNEKFFKKFENNLVDNGTIITDNMNFHGLVYLEDVSTLSRNLRQLVRKVKNYKTFLENNTKYSTQFYDIGDGIAVSVKL